jgi:hypothetical protein
MKTLILALLFVATAARADVFARGGPLTTNNDDTCDIAVMPAATLLLPYFEVNLDAPRGTRETTLFTVTNVTNVEQIAHVTLWTNRGFPVVTFDVYLTGYDVQSLDLFDVLVLGQIAPPEGTGTAFQEGDFSDPNTSLDRRNCERVPPQLPSSALERLRSAFTRGTIGTDCKEIGQPTRFATGYATIDVVSACGSPLTPQDPAYYEGLLRHDNVLTGEYVHVEPQNAARAPSPLVHIRAIPEGETAATRAAFPDAFTVNFPRTFYSRYQNGRKTDGRQPLPSRFALPWFRAGDYSSQFLLWHEPQITDSACASYEVNDRLNFAEIVVFDEDENPVGKPLWEGPLAPPPPDGWDDLRTPVTARLDYGYNGFPEHPDDSAKAGWTFVNVDDNYTEGVTQGWVVAVRRSPHAIFLTDGTALGNGCSPAIPESEINDDRSGVTVNPAPNRNGKR